ncbi:MAG: hypothetical protein E7330_05715 [Clostridiales bacterium]|nr:hypothetical protein [Clostridiales bacterium]
MTKKLLCCILILGLLLPAAAFAEDVTACELTLSTSLNAQTNVMTLEVHMTKVEAMRFLQFSVAYDEGALTYAEGSIACGIDSLSAPTLNHRDGELLFAWDAVTGADAEGVVLRADFTVNNENGLLEEASFAAALEALHAGEGIIGAAVSTNWSDTPAEITVSTGYLYGDANCDGEYDLQDAVFLAACAKGSAAITAAGRLNASIAAGAAPTALDSLRLAKGLVF